MLHWRRTKTRLDQDARELRRHYDELMSILARVIDAKDVYTSGHTERVIQYSLAIGKSLGLAHPDMGTLRLAALLHDIGKIGIPDHILRKPDKLTSEEWEEVKKHPITGEHILKSSAGLEEVRTAVRCHQERYDGKGFPDSIRGEAIPLHSRIIAIADAYDAMTSDRSYRSALSKEAALREVERCAGAQFDPELVLVFLELTGYKHAPAPRGGGAATLLAQISIRSYEMEAQRLRKASPGITDRDLEEGLRISFPVLDTRGAWKIMDAVDRPGELTDDISPDKADEVTRMKENEYKLRLSDRMHFTVGEIITFRGRNYNLINVSELPAGGYEYHLKR